MRMTAPAIGGAAIALAVALVWFLQPTPERRLAPELEAILPSERPAERSPPSVSDAASVAASASDASSQSFAENGALMPERSPLPGEAPRTSMAQALANHQQNLLIQNRNPVAAIPLELADREREFAAEPIDGTWAPGAEAKLLSTFAQIAGLKLVDLQVQCRSTMCEVQLTQSIAFSRGSSREPPFDIGDHAGMEPRWTLTVVDGAASGRPPQLGDPPLPLKSIAYLWRDGFVPQQPPIVPPAPRQPGGL
jgi:hypothetical protein